MSSREKRESDYPVQLESQFIIRLPQKPAKVLSELIKSGENFKNRLKIQIQDDLRHGELRFDHWLLHTKIVDLPTIVESWKTIDSKSLYKSADICQIMICKEELDDTTEDEASSKNKKKDPLKVDKKYLWPHGITPPTKNIRRRRFRKTLRKKCAESPEIEKEVKRLLRADNEAVSFMWEIITEEDEQLHKNGSTQSFSQKETKDTNKNITFSNHTSKVEDIFGGALSDSDIEDENVNVDPKEGTPILCQESLSKTNSIDGLEPIKRGNLVGDMRSDMSEFDKKKALLTKRNMILINKPSDSYKTDNIRQQSTLSSNSNLDLLLQGYVTELEELRRRKQRTQLEISSLENMTLRKRFQDILKTINKEIIMKEMEYHKLKLRIK